MAVQSFIEKIGSALAPLMAGAIADQSTLKDAILIICLSAWAIGAVFLIAATAIIPRDIQTLRHQLRERAEQEQARQAATASS
jgi:fucose permease